MSNRKVLVVDDDVDFVEATSIFLQAKGYTVVTASGGEEGYQKARIEKPDVMLLDVMMTHDSEGFDTARKLKEDNTTRNIPVIMVTGIKKAKNLSFRFEPDEDWLPVKAVLDKPVKPEVLLKHIVEAIQD
jgi:CheY-like chemotaxis protein